MIRNSKQSNKLSNDLNSNVSNSSIQYIKLKKITFDNYKLLHEIELDKIRSKFLYLSIPTLFILFFQCPPAGQSIVIFFLLISYIFDLLQVTSASILFIILTLIIFIGSLVISFIDLIQSSGYNLYLLLVYLIDCISLLFPIILYYNSLVRDFKLFFTVSYQFFSVVLPILHSTVLTIFISNRFFTNSIHLNYISLLFSFIAFVYNNQLTSPIWVTRRIEAEINQNLVNYKNNNDEYYVTSNKEENMIYTPLISLLLSFKLTALSYILIIFLSFITQIIIMYPFYKNLNIIYIVFKLLLSILFPSLLMSLNFLLYKKNVILKNVNFTFDNLSEKNLEEISNESNISVNSLREISYFLYYSKLIEKIFSISLFLLIILFQNNEIFNEIKKILGIYHFNHKYSSYIFTIFIFLLFLSYYILKKLILSSISLNSGSNKNSNSIMSQSIINMDSSSSKKYKLYFHLCIIILFYIINYIFDLNYYYYIVSTFSSILLVELHLLSLNLSSISISKFTVSYDFVKFFIVFFISIILLNIYFNGIILISINFLHLKNYSWNFLISFDIFIRLLVFFISFSLCLPALMPLSSNNISNIYSLLNLTNKNNTFNKNEKFNFSIFSTSFISNIFSFSINFLVYFTVWYELTLMDSSIWNSLPINNSSDNSFYLYSSKLFFLTFFISVILSFNLFRIQLIGLTSFLSILFIQLSKLLFYYKFKPVECLSVSFLFIITLMPFLRQINNYFNYRELYESFDTKIMSMRHSLLIEQISLSKNEWIFYSFLHFFVSILTRKTLAYRALQWWVIEKEIQWWQEISIAFSLFFLFLSSLVFIFNRKNVLIRGIFFSISMVFILIAFEGFRHHSSMLNMEIDSINLALSNLNQSSSNKTLATPIQDRSQLFFIISCLLTVACWSKFIPLENFLSCFIYSLVFGFVAAKTTVNWAFPPSVADIAALMNSNLSNKLLTKLGNISLTSFVLKNKEQVTTLRHTLRSLPFLYLYLSKILLCLFSVWNPKRVQFQIRLFHVGYLMAIFWPFFAFFLTYSLKLSDEIRSGIIWSSIISFSTLSFSYRFKEIMLLLRKSSTICPYGNFTIHSANNFNVVGYNNLNISSKNNNKVSIIYTIIIPGNISVVFITVLFTLIWVLLSFFYTNSNNLFTFPEILFPIFCLLILLIQPSYIPKKMSPINFYIFIASFWWYLLFLCKIFIFDCKNIITNTSLQLLFIHFLDKRSIPWTDNSSICFFNNKLSAIFNLFLSFFPIFSLFYSTKYLNFNNNSNKPYKIINLFFFLSTSLSFLLSSIFSLKLLCIISLISLFIFILKKKNISGFYKYL